jgi:hypothetical protein
MSAQIMFPENPEFPLIHTRRYEVRAFRMAADRLMLRGVVVDEKPAGLYLKGDEQPLWLHHMIVDLEIVYPTFLIEKASAMFHEHPHLECTHITDHYKKLEGMSIARGFNAKVKELFAGARGCTHITALLSAMAPVAIQAGWSMRVAASSSGEPNAVEDGNFEEQRRRQFAGTINTCHMWDENGALAAKVKEGNFVEVPLSVKKRLKELGRGEEEWLNLK